MVQDYILLSIRLLRTSHSSHLHHWIHSLVSLLLVSISCWILFYFSVYCLSLLHSYRFTFHPCVDRISFNCCLAWSTIENEERIYLSLMESWRQYFIIAHILSITHFFCVYLLVVIWLSSVWLTLISLIFCLRSNHIPHH